MSSEVILLIPPSTEKCNFNVDETSTLILLQFVVHTVEDVLHSSILDGIPSYFNIEKKTKAIVGPQFLIFTYLFPTYYFSSKF